jgi:hypothetical protein
MKVNWLRSMLFAGVLVFLFLPLLQKYLHIKEEYKPLRGSYTTATDTALTAERWFSGVYSEVKERWLQENFGLHDYYIRLNNQINWTFFRKPQIVYVVTGKDDYMFETGYIISYFGRNFVGADSVDRVVSKLKKVQDTLSRINKLIIPVFALGKATFYPDKIPEAYKSPPGVSNYLYIRERLRHDGVDHIDFNRYYSGLRHRSAVPLYPQFGIHWSSYTALSAFDSIVRYAEYKLHKDLPDMRVTGFEMTGALRDSDYDLGDALNLLWNPKTFPMGYPRYTVVNDSTRHRKLNLLVIGDSFWFQIYNTGLQRQVFNDRFWFYNEQMFPESDTSPLFVSQVNFEDYVRAADVILILHAEGTLHRFGAGFIHSCYRMYYPTGN